MVDVGFNLRSVWSGVQKRGLRRNGVHPSFGSHKRGSLDFVSAPRTGLSDACSAVW